MWLFGSVFKIQRHPWLVSIDVKYWRMTRSVSATLSVLTLASVCTHVKLARATQVVMVSFHTPQNDTSHTGARKSSNELNGLLLLSTGVTHSLTQIKHTPMPIVNLEAQDGQLPEDGEAD